MSRSLTTREKRLLGLCLGVLVIMATVLLANTFIQKRSVLVRQIAELENQKKENEMLLGDREFWEKRKQWIEQTMPTTDSLGKSQGQLLEALQNQALDREIKVLQQTLLDPVVTSDYREIAINVRLYGDQTKMLQWLASIQSPEKFQAIKAMEFELDSRSKAATPQAQCNLTFAQWFKPESGFTD